MIKKALCTVLTLITLSTIATIGHAQTCYTVHGDVETFNLPPDGSFQRGTITLIAKDKWGNEAFHKSGILDGQITGASNQAIFLSHTATFGTNEDIFQTIDDEAKTKEVIDDCTSLVSETIRTIDPDQSFGFFANTKSANIKAIGYIKTCPSVDPNEFVLLGEICMQ